MACAVETHYCLQSDCKRVSYVFNKNDHHHIGYDVTYFGKVKKVLQFVIVGDTLFIACK